VRLEVRDSGIGVPDAAKHKLFSKFFRADNAQIVRPDGTGLGLYLAKRVVEDQGGTIIFSSVEGKGSTFGFELPFKPVTPIREVAHVR
jgi:signal transduction histidine kinase